MGKLIYSLAMSLDNKIAKPDGDVDWLQKIPNPDQSDYGFNNFFNSVHTTIMGFNTYEIISGFDVEWPYKEKTSYVFTNKNKLPNDPNVTFINEKHIAFLKDLKDRERDDIWLVGGGMLATELFNQKLIDQFLLHIMPIILGKGVPFILPNADEKMINLITSKAYNSGVIETLYKVV
ncbi:MAG: dihydrofolate reductase family protein [Balneolales bacterium]